MLYSALPSILKPNIVLSVMVFGLMCPITLTALWLYINYTNDVIKVWVKRLSYCYEDHRYTAQASYSHIPSVPLLHLLNSIFLITFSADITLSPESDLLIQFYYLTQSGQVSYSIRSNNW